MEKYKFHRIDKEKGIDIWEDVLPELWRWEAVYNDKTRLKQFDGEGIFHQIREIDQSKLAVLRVYSPQYTNTFSLLFDPRYMKLIYFYRNTVLNATTSDEIKIKTYCFGYENNVHGTVVKVINMILPNGEMVTTYDPTKVIIS